MLPLLLGWLLAVGVVVGFIVRITSGPERCPSCKARAVREWWAPRSSAAPTAHFHRCERCGLRLRRLFPGDWEDASAARYDAHYANAPPMPPGRSYRRDRAPARPSSL